MGGIRIRLFGPPRIDRDGRIMDLGRKKATALAACLALAPGGIPRDAAAALLWPEKERASAKAELRRSLSVLVTHLGPGVIEAGHGTVGISTGVDVDVLRFRALAAECARHGHAPSATCPRCLPLLAEAALLAGAEFMSGFSLADAPGFDDWARSESEKLRSERSDVLQRLAQVREADGDLRGALEAAREWLALDTLCEPAHRALMELYAKAGQRSAALRQYEACVRILREEAAARPEEETTALWNRLREG